MTVTVVSPSFCFSWALVEQLRLVWFFPPRCRSTGHSTSPRLTHTGNDGRSNRPCAGGGGVSRSTKEMMGICWLASMGKQRERALSIVGEERVAFVLKGKLDAGTHICLSSGGVFTETKLSPDRRL